MIKSYLKSHKLKHQTAILWISHFMVNQT